MEIKYECTYTGRIIDELIDGGYTVDQTTVDTSLPHLQCLRLIRLFIVRNTSLLQYEITLLPVLVDPRSTLFLHPSHLSCRCRELTHVGDDEELSA
jgi:hypothetical protein